MTQLDRRALLGALITALLMVGAEALSFLI